MVNAQAEWFASYARRKIMVCGEMDIALAAVWGRNFDGSDARNARRAVQK